MARNLRFGSFYSGLRRWRVLSSIVAVCAIETHHYGAEFPEGARLFMETHCFDCHDHETAKGELDLSSLKFEPEDPANLKRWVRIHDRVRDGEMPPKEKSRPDGEQIEFFLAELAVPMIAADDERARRNGRAKLRRLNRYHYENSLRDLLQAPWLQVKDMLPEDGEAHRFNTVGGALDISHVQLARYLAAAENAIWLVLAASQEETHT